MLAVKQNTAVVVLKEIRFYFQLTRKCDEIQLNLIRILVVSGMWAQRYTIVQKNFFFKTICWITIHRYFEVSKC